MRYHIFVYFHLGRADAKQVKLIEAQPSNGFATEKKAEQQLIALIENREGYFFDREGYIFTIMKTYKSK